MPRSIYSILKCAVLQYLLDQTSCYYLFHALSLHVRRHCLRAATSRERLLFTSASSATPTF